MPIAPHPSHPPARPFPPGDRTSLLLRLFRRDGEPSMALQSALITFQCASLGDLAARAALPKDDPSYLSPHQVVSVRFAGNLDRPSALAQYLFSREQLVEARREARSRVGSGGRGTGPAVVSPSLSAPPPLLLLPPAPPSDTSPSIDTPASATPLLPSSLFP